MVGIPSSSKYLLNEHFCLFILLFLSFSTASRLALPPFVLFQTETTTIHLCPEVQALDVFLYSFYSSSNPSFNLNIFITSPSFPTNPFKNLKYTSHFQITFQFQSSSFRIKQKYIIQKKLQMENLLPTVSLSYRTNTNSKPSRLPQSNPSDISIPVTFAQFANKPSRCTSGITNKTSKTSSDKVYIQELCLENSKWLIFNSEKQDGMQGRCSRPFTTTSKSRNKLQSNKTGRTQQPYFTSFFPSQKIKQRIFTKNHTTDFQSKTDAKTNRYDLTTMRDSKLHKINTNKVKFKKEKRVLLQTEIPQDKEKENCNNSKQRYTGRKSNHSKSNCSLKNQSFVNQNINTARSKTQSKRSPQKSVSKSPPKSNKKSLKKMKSLNCSASDKLKTKNNLFPQLSQVSSMACINHNYFQITQCLSPVQKFNPLTLMPPLTSNPYEDFPQMNYFYAYQPSMSNKHAPEVSTPAFREEQRENTKRQEHPFDQIKNRSSIMCQSAHANNKSSRFSVNCEKQGSKEGKSPKKEDKRWESEVENIENHDKITKETDKLMNSKCQKSSSRQQPHLTFKGPIAQPPSILQPQPQQQFLQGIDSSFKIQTFFQPQQHISIIQIKKTAQTAYFPQNIKTPLFIKANPDTLTPYKNTSLVQLLNLFLKVQPQIIKNIFQSHMNSSIYTCQIFNKEREKISISVDDLFPFDKNMYPLFGTVQQYIWFAVLIKVLAKMKNSFLAVSLLNFQDIFTLMTNYTLHDFTQTLAISDNPAQDLSTLLKQTKKKNIFIIVQNGKDLYKLQKLEYKKTISQQNEEHQQNYLSGIMKMRQTKQHLRRESKMKSLTNFIKNKKQMISIERSIHNTFVKIVGEKSTYLVRMRDILAGEYQIWVPISAYEEENIDVGVNLYRYDNIQ